MKRHRHRKSRAKVGIDGEKAVAYSIRRSFGRMPYYLYNNLMFIDKHGNPFQVDHLILTPAGLLVVESKNWSGIVYGDIAESHWSYVPRGRGLIKRIYSPILQNQSHTEKLQAVLGNGMMVFSSVVFSHPGGLQIITPHKPDCVMTIAGFEEFLVGWKRREPLMTKGQLEEWNRMILATRSTNQYMVGRLRNFARSSELRGRLMARREYRQVK